MPCMLSMHETTHRLRFPDSESIPKAPSFTPTTKKTSKFPLLSDGNPPIPLTKVQYYEKSSIWCRQHAIEHESPRVFISSMDQCFWGRRAPCLTGRVSLEYWNRDKCHPCRPQRYYGGQRLAGYIRYPCYREWAKTCIHIDHELLAQVFMQTTKNVAIPLCPYVQIQWHNDGCLDDIILPWWSYQLHIKQ